MTLERAIEINTINNDHNPNYTDAERCQAHQLGIEALKVLDLARFNSNGEWPPPLPGETEEEK